MLATAADHLPVGTGWSYEFKWDGVRALAAIEAGKVRLYARSGAEITKAYPGAAEPRPSTRGHRGASGGPRR